MADRCLHRDHQQNALGKWGLCPFQEPEMVSGLYRVVLPSGSEEVTVSHKLRNLGKGVE